MLVEVRETLIEALEEEMPPPVAAGDVAVRRIFTVARTASVIEAKERLNQLRVNALPVVDGGEHAFVGLVTRQVLDRAIGHGWGDKQVETVSIAPSGTVGETSRSRP
jgi:CBS domain-containing protein